MKRFLRPSAKKTDILPLALLLSLAVLFIGDLAGLLILYFSGNKNIFEQLTNSENLTAFMNNYLICIGVWIVIFLFILIPKKNRPMLKGLGYSRNGNTVKGFLAGLLLGFGTNALCVAGSLITGDIKLSYFGFEPLTLLIFFTAVFIQSTSEELVLRLYLYQKLRRRYRHPAVAILVNTIFFMALHMANPGFNVSAAVQMLLVSLIFSMLVYYYGCFWAAAAFHTAWNYTQNLIFGLPNSGLISSYSLFKLDAVSARSGFFYDVSFGVEGSIGCCVILFLLGIFLFIKNRGRGERIDLWE